MFFIEKVTVNEIPSSLSLTMFICTCLFIKYKLSSDVSPWSLSCPTLPNTFSLSRWLTGKCFEQTHLRYYDSQDSWGRIANRLVEQCTCQNGRAFCERTRYRGTTSRTFRFVCYCLFVCVCLCFKDTDPHLFVHNSKPFNVLHQQPLYLIRFYFFIFSSLSRIVDSLHCSA